MAKHADPVHMRAQNEAPETDEQESEEERIHREWDFARDGYGGETDYSGM